jgi:hypothetical protein
MNHFGDRDIIAFTSALWPYPLPDPEVSARLTEAAIRNADRNSRWLGWALYRAGRYDEAIGRLQWGGPVDLAFLAMADHRLGHRKEALHSLDELRGMQDQFPTFPEFFWIHLAVRLLRSEAEAVVLYDPVFPEDPFAW